MNKSVLNFLTAPAFIIYMESLKLVRNIPNPFYLQFFAHEITDRLTWEAVNNGLENPVVANVINFDSTGQQVKDDEITTLSGDIVPITMSKKRGEKMLIQLNSTLDAAKEALKGKMFDDASYVLQSVKNRLDFYVMQMLSSGQVILDSDTNAGGKIVTLDFGLDSWQTKAATGATKYWSAKTTATPIADIRLRVKEMKANGYIPRYLLMEDATWNNMILTDEVKDLIISTNGTTVKNPLISLEIINSVLLAARLPQIVVVEDNMRYVKADGSFDNTRRAWKAGYISFLTSLEQGKTLFAPTAEELSTTTFPGVLAKVDDVTIMKYSKIDPFNEFTKGKANAFPAWGRSTECLIMNTLGTSF